MAKGNRYMQDHAPGRSFPVHGGTCYVVDEPLEDVPVVDESVLDSPDVATIETGVTLDTEDGFVYLSQSFARHLHSLHWLVSTASLVLAVATAVTDWQYVTGTGHVLTWPVLLVIGLVGPGLRGAQLLWHRLRGFTFESRIPISAIETVELTTTDIRWYLKTRRTVPTFVVRYRDAGRTKRRRILLNPRYEDEHLRTGMDAFGSAGLSVHVDESAHELVP